MKNAVTGRIIARVVTDAPRIVQLRLLCLYCLLEGLHASVADEPAVLLRSADEHKDQTYFLWRVPGATFSRVLFPVGDYASKADVRAACACRGLGVEAKPDSDGICFVGPVGMRTFLLDALERRAGDVVEWETGHVKSISLYLQYGIYFSPSICHFPAVIYYGAILHWL